MIFRAHFENVEDGAVGSSLTKPYLGPFSEDRRKKEREGESENQICRLFGGERGIRTRHRLLTIQWLRVNVPPLRSLDSPGIPFFASVFSSQ